MSEPKPVNKLLKQFVTVFYFVVNKVSHETTVNPVFVPTVRLLSGIVFRLTVRVVLVVQERTDAEDDQVLFLGSLANGSDSRKVYIRVVGSNSTDRF